MYEQDNNNNINSGNSTDGGSEYSYTRESIPHRSYVDASYATSDEIPTSPRSYYTPPQKEGPPKKVKPPKEKKKSSGMIRLVCACLACALLGGLGGGAIVASQISDSNGNSSDAQDGVISVAPPSETQVPNAKPVSRTDVLTGAEIYTLGCTQAVAITTEITYTNFLGMKTSVPVSGSGFIASKDGYIITNYHVIEEAYKGGYNISVVLYNGETYKAKIIGAEEQNDLAVLKIDAKNLSAATLGNSEDMQVGETVYAIGNPLGELSFTMTSGMVSALDREITTSSKNEGGTATTITNNMFQIDAAVNEGNSGGPVYNEHGEVIGIVTAKYSSAGVEGLGFAIPINDVVSIVNQLIENGYVSGKASFGITVTTVDSSVAQYYNMVEGAYVYSVTAGSCSEKAGLKVGDIITSINGETVRSSSELTNKKKDFKAGDSVTLKIYRAGEYYEMTVVLDEEVPANSVTKPDSKPEVTVIPKQ